MPILYTHKTGHISSFTFQGDEDTALDILFNLDWNAEEFNLNSLTFLELIDSYNNIDLYYQENTNTYYYIKSK